MLNIEPPKQKNGDSSASDTNPNSALWADVSLPGIFLQTILIFAVLASIGATIYIVTTGKSGESFTEFYILGLDGKAANYPVNIILGDEAGAMLGIVNHEYEKVEYRVAIKINGVLNKELDSVTLVHEEKWEDEVRFIPTTAGEDQKVEFILYKQGEENPYLTLRLWLNVKEQ